MAFQCSTASRVSMQSVRPTISLTVRNPRSAMISRICSAMNIMKLITCSGLPVNFFRSSSSCVATPTEQVLRWHFRSMMQPLTTSAVVAKPNSSAPSMQAMATSLPVLSCPSVCTTMRPTQVVLHQHLLGLGHAQLPGDAGVLHGGLRRGAGAAVVAADEHHVRLALGNAGGDGAHPDLGHQLDVDARPVIGALEIVDELGQVLDGVDVVVRRRRRDQPPPPESTCAPWRWARTPCGRATVRLRRAWPPGPS